MKRPLLLEVFVSSACCREIENKLISGTWTKNTCRFLVVFGSYGFRRNYYFWHRKETDTDHVFLTHQSFQILMTDCKALWVWKIFNFGNILHCIDYECIMSSLKDSHNSFSGFPLMIPSTYEIIFFILNLFQPFYYRNFFDHAVQYLLHLHVHRVLHVPGIFNSVNNCTCFLFRILVLFFINLIRNFCDINTCTGI